MSLSSTKGKDHSHGNMDIPETAKIKDIMIENVKTVDQETSILDVTKLMSTNEIGAVIVLSPIKEAMGIFTERDLLNRVVSKELSMDTKVKDVMTPNFDCLQLEDQLKDIPKIMLDGNFRNLPVVNGHEVIGLVTIKEIMEFLIKGD
jgi:signal-transduction protein with cAMP-binding, CBS, and nucleotidyltransferase domain